tara:strand:+ start:533 stop:745 length:213 start_codon:yes stop_codon:yes gene_type:complete
LGSPCLECRLVAVREFIPLTRGEYDISHEGWVVLVTREIETQTIIIDEEFYIFSEAVASDEGEVDTDQLL